MTASDWASDISEAQQAGIDGFVMDIAPEDTNTDSVLQTAFSAAETAGFKLLLSFDYESDGIWDASDVIDLINQYSDSSAYFQYNGAPLVTTFEGTNNIDDWTSIKTSTGCYFIPDWSSLGANGVASYFDIADGAMNWGAWPDGAANMDISGDMDYMNVLGDRPYMMAVSPWFYTNVPDYDKNWVWRGDDLWHDRWQEAITLQPAIVEILTWNDYGESHYIGPIYESGIPEGADYVEGFPHDGWRALLPQYIAAYKSNNATTNATSEQISYWYKLAPSTSGTVDGTTGNDPAEGQTEVSPLAVSQDMIFATIYVSQASDFSIQVGDNTATSLTASTAGLNHFSVDMNGQTGNITFTISRNGQTIVTTTGPELVASPANGIVNFNAYVGSS